MDRDAFLDQLRQSRALGEEQLRRAESLGADTAAALAAALSPRGC